jgi:hypothetical protein
MSTLEVSNLNDGTKTVATTNLTNGSAKHWCFFVGTGTIAIQDSFNTASLTDHGTGNYGANLTNAMSDANQGLFGLASTGELADNRGTAGEARVASFNSSGTLTDASRCNSQLQGDLA